MTCTLLCSQEKLYFLMKKKWVKRYDVNMGCHDGAEVCELLGSYLLSKPSNIGNKITVILYRGDRLEIL